MSRVARPSPEQVRELPLLHEVTVPPEYEDVNGHMSIAHYMGIHAGLMLASGSHRRCLAELRGRSGCKQRP